MTREEQWQEHSRRLDRQNELVHSLQCFRGAAAVERVGTESAEDERELVLREMKLSTM